MYSLIPAEHQAVVKTIVEEVQGRIPVTVGTGFNRQMAIELAQQSSHAGGDATRNLSHRRDMESPS